MLAVFGPVTEDAGDMIGARQKASSRARRRSVNLQKRILKSQTFLSGFGSVLAGYIRLVHGTGKVVREPGDIGEIARRYHPAILAMWHGQFLLLPMMNEPGIPIQAMVSRHRDAELIAHALKRFDMDLIRGAGAGTRKTDRGGTRALRSAVEALRDNISVAMTADVPPGPARIAGIGIAMIASFSGRPIVPIATATRRYLAVNAWDRFTINLPFSKLAKVIGDPIWVSENAGEAELETARQRVEDELDRITARAYELADADPRRADPRIAWAERKASV